MTKKALLALLIAIFLPLTGYLLVSYYSNRDVKMPPRYFYDSVTVSQSNGKNVYDTVWHSVKTMRFKNQLNQDVSLDDLKGKVIVLDFFFTRCPTICPKLTTAMRKLQKSFPDNDSIVQFISVSVDPIHDSVDVLRKYAEKFEVNPDNWWLVTGDKDSIYDFAFSEIKASIADVNVDTAFVHTENFFLLDRDRVVRGWYNGLDTMAQSRLVRDIPLLMLEKDKSAPSVIFYGKQSTKPTESNKTMNMTSATSQKLPQPLLKNNDRKAKIIIWIVSILIFLTIAGLSRIKLNIDVDFNTRYFALANAIINTIVSICLIAGLMAVKARKFEVHRKFMIAAISLSVLFLISYVCHHLTTTDTKFGDVNGDGIVSIDEKNAVGSIRYIYYFILLTHIPLAGIILPFILFTAYRALSGEYQRHKKIARVTFPLWLYVSVTGVVIYLMISPYYT